MDAELEDAAGVVERPKKLLRVVDPVLGMKALDDAPRTLAGAPTGLFDHLRGERAAVQIRAISLAFGGRHVAQLQSEAPSVAVAGLAVQNEAQRKDVLVEELCDAVLLSSNEVALESVAGGVDQNNKLRAARQLR